MNERVQTPTVFQDCGCQDAETDRKTEFKTHLSWPSSRGVPGGSIMDDNVDAQPVDPLAGEQHVKELWQSLGIGENGFLTVSELGTVCRHIGMDEMKEWEVHQLFDQLDADGDGQVTFDEFLTEMFQYSAPKFEQAVSSPQHHQHQLHHLSSSSSSPPQSTSSNVSRTKSRRRRSFIRKTGMSHYESFFLSQGETSLSFTTLDATKRGRIKGEDLVELWESYGIPNAVDILKGYGLEPDRELSHSKLASILEDELLFTADHTPKLQVAIITCLQECKNLRCLLEQASSERDRLIIGLRESNIRSQILAEEDDERHAALEKTLQSKVLSMEGIYQDQIKNLKDELKKEREERMDLMDEHNQLMEKMTNSYREESKKLKEDLSTTQEDLRQTQSELNEVRERIKDLERQKHKLQYQLSVEKLKSGGKSLSEQWELYQSTNDNHNLMRQQITQLQNENKHLGDRLEELSPQCRRINHRTTDRRKNLSRSMSLREQSLGEVLQVGTIDVLHRPSSGNVDRDEFNQMQRELKQLKKNMEIEHKEIEHAYLIEIAQIEERHSYEMAEAIKQAKREKEKLVEDRVKRQQESLSKLEKELQTQFAFEKQDLLLKHETEKNLLEQKLAEDKIRLTERLRSEYMDDLQRKTRQMERSMSGDFYPWQVAGKVSTSQNTLNEETPMEQVRKSISPPPASDNVPSQSVTNNAGDESWPDSDRNAGNQFHPGPSTASIGSAQQTNEQLSPNPNPSSGHPEGRNSSSNTDTESIPIQNPISTAEMMASLPNIYEEIALVSSHHCSTSSMCYTATGKGDRRASSVSSEVAMDGDRGVGDSGHTKVVDRVASSLKANGQGSGKKLIIQLCCVEELHKADESKLQSLFGKGMESKLREEFLKALRKYRDEEILRMNSMDNDNNVSDMSVSDSTSRSRNIPSSPSSTSSTSSSSFSESHRSKSFRIRNKELDADGDNRHLIHRYEEKLKSKEREIQKLKKRCSMAPSETGPPKEYSVKSAVTNLGYQLLFPRQKQNKATQTEQRRHLHRNMSDLHLKYFYQEEKLQNLEKELSHREEQTHSVMKNVEDTYRNVIHQIEEEREQLKNQLISATEALQDQSGKLQEQQSKSMNRDLLLKDLYLQNAELMRSLQQMEEQLRTADQKNLQLEEKCRVLDKVLQKVCSSSVC